MVYQLVFVNKLYKIRWEIIYLRFTCEMFSAMIAYDLFIIMRLTESLFTDCLHQKYGEKVYQYISKVYLRVVYQGEARFRSQFIYKTV